jgi:hypothetical protein
LWTITFETARDLSAATQISGMTGALVWSRGPSNHATRPQREVRKLVKRLHFWGIVDTAFLNFNWWEKRWANHLKIHTDFLDCNDAHSTRWLANVSTIFIQTLITKLKQAIPQRGRPSI